MQDFIDKTEAASGTPLNRANLMAIQGFVPCEVKISSNQIEETYGNGCKLTTTFNDDGSITEVFVGKKTITKTTRLVADEMITEVVI